MSKTYHQDPFGVKKTLKMKQGNVGYYCLEELDKQKSFNLGRLPFSIKILMEAVLRQVDGITITEDDVIRLTEWDPTHNTKDEIPFKPSRIIMQDFTGVPAVVDLAVMRDALIDLNANPALINPLIPVDLVIDHSVQVDHYGTRRALEYNAEMEFKRNRERYEFLRWGAEAFECFRVVPPATGIVHQVNLEYIADVVQLRNIENNPVAFPDTLVGTDSHTTMINGLGVLGWGVGGIEAEAALLGEPVSLVMPDVIGFKLTDKLLDGVTATDLVLTITEILRKYGVVGKFIEFFGPGVSTLSLPDRATISNMTPEFGATLTFFPVDEETLAYLKNTGRSASKTELVELYTKEQGIFRTDNTPEPDFTDVVELDMSAVDPSIAGPKRPQDRIPLKSVKGAVHSYFSAGSKVDNSKYEKESYERLLNNGGKEPEINKQSASGVKIAQIELDGKKIELKNGSVVIAAITSCTNTSNPSVMIGAGLLAKKAVELGLKVSPHVKTSLAPGSRVVTQYLEKSGLLSYLEALGFHLVGYGCTTCIGNSGPLHPIISKAIQKNDLIAVSILSGNRNFEGRIHPDVRANFLASPPLVTAYAIAGTINIDLTEDPVSLDPNGSPVFLKDIWPSQVEIQKAVKENVLASLFNEEYSNVFTGNKTWNDVKISGEKVYSWDPDSTYIRKPPFFKGIKRDIPDVPSIKAAHILALFGDTITTDHISPAGAIPVDSPAGNWLIERGIKPYDFNTYGSRRGNHEVMIRGTFGNIRIKNALVPGLEGGYTLYIPTGEELSIYDAAMKYRKKMIPLLIMAGKEYGAGSSRDWAAKGTALLGVRAVIAESFERIHRSNLIGMGVLPLQFTDDQNPSSLGVTGHEMFDIEDIKYPGQRITVKAVDKNGREFQFSALVRIDTQIELEYYKNGGILHKVIRKLAGNK